MIGSNEQIGSLWLLAAQEDEAVLAAVVERLAIRHGRPQFHPHLTVLGDIPAPLPALKGVAETVARATQAFSLPISDIVLGEAFFRSFYAAFASAAELLALRQTAERLFPALAGDFMPHVSLLYGDVPSAEKQASAAEIRKELKGRPIRFNRIVLTNSANAVPIADWRIVSNYGLGGSSPA